MLYRCLAAGMPSAMFVQSGIFDFVLRIFLFSKEVLLGYNPALPQ